MIKISDKICKGLISFEQKSGLLLFTAVVITFISLSSCTETSAKDHENKGPFKYREIFLPEGIGANADRLNLNTLDEDWGIWGHNIAKVIPEEHSHNIYAKVNGSTMKKQYCFSSNHLFEYIDEYIDRHYDEDERIRFAIVPNDNDIVCLCEKCVKAGNTKGNASPAVNKLVRKLAHKFPGHIFFTSDYRTTRGLPRDSMPANTGVLLSAINFPLSAVPTPEETRFVNRIKAWSQTTPRILIWDYINNFDDYFTPYPILGPMQRRFQNYRDNKVTALFLNGSGNDVSSLSRLHTEILAALTEDPELDWKYLLKEKARAIYPVTGELIAEYMIAQEDNLAQKGVSLPLYDGVEKARKTYLDEEQFIKFHNNLLKLRHKTTGVEKDEIDTLLGQLALTRMELNRINGNPLESEKYIADLERLTRKGVLGYNESGWSIESYINDYRYLMNHYRDSSKGNKLKGVRLTPLTALDPDYSDISILTDGVLGIPSNYHNGNMIVSPQSYTQIALPNNLNLSKIRVWMSYNPAYKIKLPESVSLRGGGREIKNIQPSYPANLSGHSYVEFDVPKGINGSLVLTFNKEEDTKSFAIEEIEGY